MNAVRKHAFPAQVLCGPFRSREMESGKPGCDHAVHFFGEGLRQIAGAQSSLHMPDRNSPVKSSQGATESGGGVSLDEYQVRLLLLQNRLERGQDSGARLGESLAREHQIEVVIRLDPEYR